MGGKQDMSGDATNAVPVSLKGEPDALVIAWSDGLTQRLRWQQLREQCPCATCRVKRSQPAPLFNVLRPEEAQPVRATRMQPLGNYAYQIEFNDGHSTGIYSLDFLRGLQDG